MASQYLPGSSEGDAVLLTSNADGGRVDDRHHQLNVIDEHFVEELLVSMDGTARGQVEFCRRSLRVASDSPVLEVDQINVSIQVALLAHKVGHDTERLDFLTEDGGRQEALEAEQLTFLDGEGHALNGQTSGDWSSSLEWSLRWPPSTHLVKARISQQLDALDLGARLGELFFEADSFVADRKVGAVIGQE